jgi:hypothetical protein
MGDTMSSDVVVCTWKSNAPKHAYPARKVTIKRRRSCQLLASRPGPRSLRIDDIAGKEAARKTIPTRTIENKITVIVIVQCYRATDNRRGKCLCWAEFGLK